MFSPCNDFYLSRSFRLLNILIARESDNRFDKNGSNLDWTVWVSHTSCIECCKFPMESMGCASTHSSISLREVIRLRPNCHFRIDQKRALFFARSYLIYSHLAFAVWRIEFHFPLSHYSSPERRIEYYLWIPVWLAAGNKTDKRTLKWLSRPALWA